MVSLSAAMAIEVAMGGSVEKIHDLNGGEPSETSRIGVLLIPGFALMSYASLAEPLRAANIKGKGTVFQLIHVAVSGSTSVSSSGLEISCAESVGSAAGLFDILFVVAGGNPATFSDAPTLQWLRMLARRGVVLGGVSGGPVILAKAGLLDNHRATVHWEHANLFEELYPDVALERNLYVIDRKRITCAGGIAPLDLMHTLIAQQFGKEFAWQVSDWFLQTSVRGASGAQRANTAARHLTHNPKAIAAIEVMENSMANPMSLGQIAEIVCVSTRQLNRIFKNALGVTTMGYYRTLRLNAARQLLEQTPMSITDVAIATGFESPAHFTTLFRRYAGYAPRDYREKKQRPQFRAGFDSSTTFGDAV
ncbi:MAG: GlxA family transcriptional regulator [Pseudomonadota bacterium]